MICNDCANRKHKKCKKRHKTLDYQSCDCQHKVPKKVKGNDQPTVAAD